jgi:hypothetical protein
MYCRARQIVIDALKVLLAFEDDIGGILGLHDRPMIAQVEHFDDRTKALGKVIQDAMDQIDLEPIGNLLGGSKIGHTDKQVVDEWMVDVSILQLGGQSAMAVKIDLQSKRAPGGHAHIAKPSFIHFFQQLSVLSDRD